MTNFNQKFIHLKVEKIKKLEEKEKKEKVNKYYTVDDLIVLIINCYCCINLKSTSKYSSLLQLF